MAGYGREMLRRCIVQQQAQVYQEVCGLLPLRLDDRILHSVSARVLPSLIPSGMFLQYVVGLQPPVSLHP